MNRRLTFSIIFTFFFLISIGTITALVPTSVGASPSNNTSVKADQTTASYKYIIKDFFGKIAVFKQDSNQPIKITETAVESLSDYDKQQLKKGINAVDEKELRRLLEDYCS